jgi:hypothetical protein
MDYTGEQMPVVLPKQYEFATVYRTAEELAAGIAAKHFLPATVQRELCDRVAELLKLEHETIALALERVAADCREEARQHYASGAYKDGDRATAKGLSLESIARFIRIRAAQAAKEKSCG